jgi:hypothetical protein
MQLRVILVGTADQAAHYQAWWSAGSTSFPDLGNVRASIARYCSLLMLVKLTIGQYEQFGDLSFTAEPCDRQVDFGAEEPLDVSVNLT